MLCRRFWRGSIRNSIGRKTQSPDKFRRLNRILQISMPSFSKSRESTRHLLLSQTSKRSCQSEACYYQVRDVAERQVCVRSRLGVNGTMSEVRFESTVDIACWGRLNVEASRYWQGSGSSLGQSAAQRAKGAWIERAGLFPCSLEQSPGKKAILDHCYQSLLQQAHAP
jgi:hypothetical protein